jgi:hypothetical protein
MVLGVFSALEVSHPLLKLYLSAIADVAGSSSLFATKAFKADDALSEFGPKVVVTTPNYLTVQVGS